MGGEKISRVLLTVYDFDEFDTNFEGYEHLQYIIGQVETCPTTGKEHYQIFVKWNKQVTMKFIKKYFGNTCHIEKARGTDEQCIKYCSKEETKVAGTEFEFGTCKKSGERTDLNLIKNEILEGKSVNEILMEDAVKYHQYGRTLNKIEELVLLKKFRTEMTIGIWYHGDSGAGKSHKAFENFSPETHYVYPNDNGWFDGYQGQEIVIINDFRGEIKYSELLQMVDKWPYSVKRRGRAPMPFTSKKVIITSSMRPEFVYYNVLEKDSIDQLLRRFEIIEVGGEGGCGNTRAQPEPLDNDDFSEFD